jgi:hypothetical protein
MRLSPKAIAYVGSAVCSLLVGFAQGACSGTSSTSARLSTDGATVYDRETDLTWSRCSVGMKWVEGKCIGVATKGAWRDATGTPWKEGWRVPSPEELESIVEKNCDNPSIDDRMFPKTVTDSYWTNRSDGLNCWTVSFSNGQSLPNFCTAHFALRLVRNGQ